MNLNSVLQDGLDTSEMISMGYLADLSDGDLMLRPHPECNHINWQVGHLVLSEFQMMSKLPQHTRPALPSGFENQYRKSAACSDDPICFVSKEHLLEAYRIQRAATLKALKSCTADDFDQPTGIDYAPNVSSLFAMQAAHWLMHCGQWVIVRRMGGKPIVI